MQILSLTIGNWEVSQNLNVIIHIFFGTYAFQEWSQEISRFLVKAAWRQGSVNASGVGRTEGCCLHLKNMNSYSVLASNKEINTSVLQVRQAFNVDTSPRLSSKSWVSPLLPLASILFPLISASLLVSKYCSFKGHFIAEFFSEQLI